MTTDDIGTSIQKSLRNLTIAVGVCLIIALGVGVYAVSLAVRIGEESEKTTAALCTLRQDLQVRVDATERFLVDHPKGFAGIPAVQLRQSLDGQKRTIAALSSLECPPRVPPE